MRTFRTALVALITASAALPPLLLGFPAIHQIAALLRQGPDAESRLEASRLVEDLEHRTELLGTRLAALAGDSDVQRAALIPVFVSRADHLLKTYLDRNPTVSQLFFYDAEGRLVTAAPYGSDLRPEFAEAADLRARCTLGPAGPGTAGFEVRGLAPGYLVVTTAVIGPDRRTRLGSLCARVPTRGFVQALSLPTEATLEQVRLGSNPIFDGAPDPRAGLVSYPAQGPGYSLTLRKPADRAYHALGRIFVLLWAALLGVLALISWAAYSLAKRLLRPFDQLYAFVGRYSQGDYRAEPPSVPFREFQETVKTLQEMAVHVEAHLDTQRRLAEADKAALRSELDALKNQLKPHFLFNALNSIAAAAEAGDPRVVPMITGLSDLYRLILRSARSPRHSLAEELLIVRHYLELEALRFRKRLRWEIRSDASESLAFPCLVLQTLVENAIKHGVAASIEGGDIRVEIAACGRGGVLVQVSNTGQPLDPAYRPGTGVANSTRLLEALYPGTHGFHLRTEGGRTVVSFTIQEECSA